MIQGNKWYKLRHYVRSAVEKNAKGFLSIGGPWSNHLIALSSLASSHAWQCRFLIRGHESEWVNNPAIRQMRAFGAELTGISRSDFRKITSENRSMMDFLPEAEGFIEVPLGASSAESTKEVAEWARLIYRLHDFTDLVLPLASGGTCAGMLSDLPEHVRIHAVDVLASNGKMEQVVLNMASDSGKEFPNLVWHDGYHFGAYARSNARLEHFRAQILHKNNLPSDHIYSGKTFYAVSDLAAKSAFLQGSRILVLHTGGIFDWNSNY